MENKILEAALNYAARGWAVIPISREKIPFIKWKEEDGVTSEYLRNPDNIKSWWEKWPAANVAIATGKRSGGLIVVDIDISEDEGKYGDESLKDWCNDNGYYVESNVMVRTGRGGLHLYFQSSELFGNAVDCIPSVDIRGEGGLVVAPPSIHAKTRREYEWEDCEYTDELPKVETDPDVTYFLYEMLKNNKASESHEKFVAPEVVNQGSRNSTIFKMAASLQARGDSDDLIYSICQGYNSSFNPPLDDEELLRTINSALKYEKGKLDEIVDEKVEELTNQDGTKTYKRERKSKKNSRKIVEEFTEEDLKLQTLDEYEEEEAEWTVEGYIPKNCITLLCSDGGIGKTSIWCDTIANLTKGTPTIFHKGFHGFSEDVPFTMYDPMKVMYFSKEDLTTKVLKKRIRKAGANMKMIIPLGLDDSRINKVTYDSYYLEKLIEKYNPEVVVFDALEAFLPDGVDMASRKDMRDALTSLNTLGAQFNVTFLLIMHSNKSSNSGRRRMADSSDIWDISRSALMCGQTKEQGICYMSQEKCNYGPLQKTILFSVHDDGVEFKGTSNRKDKDYQSEGAIIYASPKKDEAKGFIIDTLNEPERNGKIEVSELEKLGVAAGIAKSTLTEARSELVQDKEIKRHSEGFGPSKKYFITAIKSNPE